jgi:PEP-CTERM motif-containing protein
MFSTFRNATIGATALGLCAGSTLPAQAAYIVALQQVGVNVVATGSGSIDLTDLVAFAGTLGNAALMPNAGFIVTGENGGPFNFYRTANGPTNFGDGGLAVPDSGSGVLVGIDISTNAVGLSGDYISGSLVSDTSTYSNQTFASLGVTPGTYEWTWGTGSHSDSFTLQIGAAAVPEPASLPLLVMGLAGLGLVLRTRRA